MNLNRVYCGNAQNMDKIDDESIHLTVTSPPYYVGKKYEEYLPTLEDYFNMLKGVFSEVVRVTVPGGKIVINIGDIAVGSNYNSGFPEEILVIPKIVDHLKTLDTYVYARAVWEKDDPWANSSHVTFHDGVQHAEYRILPSWEYVFVFRKGRKARLDKTATSGRWVNKKFWKQFVHGVLKVRSIQRNDFHEAMFPEELVYKFIKMYSFPDDTILDPFMGSGTTAVVAKKTARNFIGYDLNPDYVKLAINRIDGITENMVETQVEYRDKTLNNKLQETIF